MPYARAVSKTVMPASAAAAIVSSARSSSRSSSVDRRMQPRPMRSSEAASHPGRLRTRRLRQAAGSARTGLSDWAHRRARADPVRRRTFASQRTARLADLDRRGRLRLDAIARFLQDVAIEDVDETGWGAPEHVWFVRSIRLDLVAPFLDDRKIDLVTWCSGVAAVAAGRRWSVPETPVGGSKSTACGSTSAPTDGPRGSRTSSSTRRRRGRLVSTR